MKKLFIIGNGFDISHGMKTSYKNFYQYLKDEYPDAEDNKSYLPQSTMMPDGSEVYDDNEVVSFLIELISETEGGEWNDLEKSLGLFDFDEYFDDILDEDEDDEDEWNNMRNNEDLAASLVMPVGSITELFSDWINTIEINDEISKKDDFQKLIEDKISIAINFNYTRTLELLYKMNHVCHIHGEQDGELLFGHGNHSDYSEGNMVKHVGSEDFLQEIQESLKKDTTKALNDNTDFFNNISSYIESIYSYGFSFSEVDRIYIREICNRLSKDNAIWYLNDYDSVEQREQHKFIIRSCGFQGQFSTYHIS